MVVLGLILLIVGLVAKISILTTIGAILLGRRPDPQLRADRRQQPPGLVAPHQPDDTSWPGPLGGRATVMSGAGLSARMSGAEGLVDCRSQG